MKLYAVRVDEYEPRYEIPVLVYENGHSTNRFEDGTIGVPRAIRMLAEEIFDEGNITDFICVGEEDD